MKINYLKIINMLKNPKNTTVNPENISDALKIISNSKSTALSTANRLRQGISSNVLSQLTTSQGAKFNTLQRTEQANIVKDLLNMPKDIEEAITFIIFKAKKPSAESLMILLTQKKQKVNTDLIKQMIGENSKETMDKLIKLFNQAPGGSENTKQIKDILTLLSQVTPKREASANEVLTNFILLYLPFAPLSEKQKLEVAIEDINIEEIKAKDEEKSELEKTMLVIYINTENLGRFRVAIIINPDFSLRIDIENYPEKGSDPKGVQQITEKIIQEIDRQIKKDKIKAKTEFLMHPVGASASFSAQSNDSSNSSRMGTADPEKSKRNAVIAPSKDINPVAIVAANKISQIILETDESISLLNARKDMAQE